MKLPKLVVSKLANSNLISPFVIFLEYVLPACHVSSNRITEFFQI